MCKMFNIAKGKISKIKRTTSKWQMISENADTIQGNFQPPSYKLLLLFLKN